MPTNYGNCGCNPCSTSELWTRIRLMQQRLNSTVTSVNNRFPDSLGHLVLRYQDIPDAPGGNSTTLIDGQMIQLPLNGLSMNLRKNRLDGTTTTEPIPIATRNSVGLASPSDLQAIDGLDSRVAELESQTTGSGLYPIVNGAWNNADPQDPSSVQLSKKWIFAQEVGREPIVGDAVINVNDGSFWRMVSGTGPTGFYNIWVATQNVVVATPGGVGGIASSNDTGKVYIENDYTGSVNGWDGLTASAANALSTAQGALNGVAGNTSAIAQLGMSKVDKISTPERIYGTDLNGNQTSYPLPSLGGGNLYRNTVHVEMSNVEIGGLNYQGRMFIEFYSKTDPQITNWPSIVNALGASSNIYHVASGALRQGTTSLYLQIVAFTTTQSIGVQNMPIIVTINQSGGNAANQTPYVFSATYTSNTTLVS